MVLMFLFDIFLKVLLVYTMKKTLIRHWAQRVHIDHISDVSYTLLTEALLIQKRHKLIVSTNAAIIQALDAYGQYRPHLGQLFYSPKYKLFEKACHLSALN